MKKPSPSKKCMPQVRFLDFLEGWILKKPKVWMDFFQVDWIDFSSPLKGP